MRFQGEMEVQFELRVAMFSTIVHYVAPHSAQIPFWWQPGCVRDWPLPTKPVSSQSPFRGSGSVLAGLGQLLPITPQNGEAFVSLLGADALDGLMHMEIESRGGAICRLRLVYPRLLLGGH
jgi:hypothetical protein